MRHNFRNLSIKWKIFTYFIVLTVILLALLWILQICYLESFYKLIKQKEADVAVTEVVGLLEENNDADDVDEELDTIAADSNLSLLVCDMEGQSLYGVSYLPTSRLVNIPESIFQKYVSQAEADGGSTIISFKGNHENQDEFGSQHTEEGLSGTFSDDNIPAEISEKKENDSFEMNSGSNGMYENILYVNIVNVNGEDLVVLVHSLLSPVDATVNTLRILLAWITIAMVIIALFIAWLLSKSVSKSIISVNESAKELAKGNFDVKFEGNDYREIGQLTDTLNYAAEELGKSEGFRRELIANVSHDLRTPLTMIRAYSEVMRDLPDENTPENVQVIIDEADRLTNLVNDMLDISKLEAGVLEINLSVFNLTEKIRCVLERYNKLRENEGYEIVFESDQLVYVEADEYKIYQVLYNFVNNAINYTGDDKKVIVRQKVNPGYVRIEVRDSGVGIEQDQLPYVWNRYYKVDKTHKRAVMGTGLGLSIVKNILDLHSAKYGVESEVGKGSTFWFELLTTQPPKEEK
ncbi:sensor histidine kinase [Eubacterium oxidoreducens]|uniref:histidine kinase n=1 Tax=Eubacterium oxidoreducens TaxID=1732 RepID=A0A1G6AKP4_EUBOX|nr:HAMP domain-containing sensor histidine kinase [Eubacterium oxidoreducens]SDB08850.1 Signal transduction histidine kinase [Eubacterium oxidoreducens]